MMVPNSYYCDHIIAHSNKEIQNKQQEVSVILQSKTIIYPCYKRSLH